MSKLSGQAIIKAVKRGDIVIDPFDESRVGPNSYDMTLGKELRVYRQIPDYHSGVVPLDVKKQNETTGIKIGEGGVLLMPGILYLAHTNEVGGSTKYVPCIEGRSSLARLGIQVHLTAGFGDVGFIGQWTLEIIVTHAVMVYHNIRICQLYFDTLEGECKLYQGKYGNSHGVVESKSYLDFK